MTVVPPKLVGQENCLECHYCGEPDEGRYLSALGVSTIRILWEGPPPPPPQPCPEDCADWGNYCPSPSQALQAAVLEKFYAEDAVELGLPLPCRAPGEDLPSVLTLVKLNITNFRAGAKEGVLEVVRGCGRGPALAVVPVPEEEWVAVKNLLSERATRRGT